MAVGSAEDCALRLRGHGVPERLAIVSRVETDVWLRVLASDPPIALNGRPVRSLARALPGDRLCFGTFCVDLVGDGLQDRPLPFSIMAFALRVRGGIGSGELHHGPIVHLNAAGDVVSPAAGTIEVTLIDGEIHLKPGDAAVCVNGQPIRTALQVLPDDQVQVGLRRFQIEAIANAVPEAIVQRLPVQSSPAEAATEKIGTSAENGGLWSLIGIAALIAASVAALLYFHG